MMIMHYVIGCCVFAQALVKDFKENLSFLGNKEQLLKHKFSNEIF